MDYYGINHNLPSWSVVIPNQLFKRKLFNV
jgi:hypothetical protein